MTEKYYNNNDNWVVDYSIYSEQGYYVCPEENLTKYKNTQYK